MIEQDDRSHTDSQGPAGEPVGVRVDGVSKTYSNLAVVDNVSLTISEGEVVCLVGPSGAGKSTLLAIVTGLMRPDSGQVRFKGVDVTNRPAERRNVGTVFQSFALFPHMSVFEN